MKIGVKVKLINHNLSQALKNNGFDSVSAFCRKSKISQSVFGKYLNLIATPRSKDVCKKLEKHLNLPIDFLFPPDLVEQVEKKPKTRFYFEKEVETLSIEDVDRRELSYTPETLQKSEIENAVGSALSSLSEREEFVLKKRFGFEGKEQTLDEIAKKLRVSQQRVRDIEAKALSKLRHPSRSVNLKDACIFAA